jgi:hypothetical protein
MADYSQSHSTISHGENGAASKDADQLDSAGQAILKLLHKAAGAAEANSRQALETAQQLSSQLRAAADRIAELEAEIQHYREKSERAEEWLRKISMEKRIALLTSRTTSDGKCRGGAKAPHRASTNDRRRKSASDPSQRRSLDRFPDATRRDNGLAQAST